MFLSKEKLLEDRTFVSNLANAISMVKRSYILQLLEGIQPTSEYDIDAKNSRDEFLNALYDPILERIYDDKVVENVIMEYLTLHNYFVHEVYDALTKKIMKEDGIIRIVDSILERLVSTEDGKEKITEILDKTNDIIVEHKKKSKEPWVNIVGDVWDDNEGKFKVSLDWNDSFIAMLRKQGITGEEESDVVELWLKGLANQ